MSNPTYFRSRVEKHTFNNAPYRNEMREISDDIYFPTTEEKEQKKRKMAERRKFLLRKLRYLEGK